MLVFDIETAGLPDEKLRELYVDPTYEEFAASCDSRWKEETKREKFEVAKRDGFAKFAAKSALDPTTGRVLAIGFQAADDPAKVAIEYGGGDESTLLAAFWRKYSVSRSNGPRRMIGCNIFGFDLPFLVRRSWILGVDVPSTVIPPPGRYFDVLFIDIRERWLLGQRWGECQSSLDVMARSLGCGQKNGDGKDFGKLWLGTAEQRQEAIAYLKNDLAMTAAVAKRLGIV